MTTPRNDQGRKKVNSRQKGKRIEREACEFLTTLGFPGFARTAQNRGKTGDAADIQSDQCLRGVHLEVKGDQSIDLNTVALGSAVMQALRDCGHNMAEPNSGKPWAVLWKRNRSGWRLTRAGVAGCRCTYDTTTGIREALKGLEEQAKQQEGATA